MTITDTKKGDFPRRLASFAHILIAIMNAIRSPNPKIDGNSMLKASRIFASLAARILPPDSGREATVL